ncbi:MAG: ABC transporter ATP-binding protein [Spirochaetales bacterium]|nr:ABC transporter ATP-binding protein [Spirochaetales bacterium]MBQ2125035.1 ABC transporter ATP-binding protein [Spirochaetales bacterium]MBQ2295283.1 ABC transporter ATP-binding protein [Spirochaetales bacterium]
MIKVKNLVKNYGGKKPAVNDVTFSIGKGEIVGLLGPNGAGKTTIMKMITGYLNPSQGEVLVDGINTLDDPITVKSKIGYLPERSPLYNDMTVYEYLSFVADVRGLVGNEKYQKITEMIVLVNLEKVVARKIKELSNGYKKRVGLASAMIHDPEILILDEPTAGLDPNQIIMFRKILRRLSEQKTIILSTHVLSEIEAICEKVIIINSGKIVADNSLQELMENNSKETFLDFVVEAEKLAEVENVVCGLDGAWNVEFEKKETRNQFRFKALLSSAAEFKSKLTEAVNAKGWKLVYAEEKKPNLEEIFLKLTANTQEIEHAQ